MIEKQLRQMARERDDLVRRLDFFDANIWLGKPENFPLSGFPLARELKTADLDRAVRKHRISEGMVSHWRSKTVSAQEGNAVLQEQADSLGSAYCLIWTGLPFYPANDGPLPGVDGLPQKVRGIRVFPKTHNFPLTSWSVGPLCEWLTDHHIPLFLWHIEIDWSELYHLANEFPKLNIIIESQTQKILYRTRFLFPLMRKCPNIFVELSNFIGQGFIEYAVKEYSSERLIFGSFLPMSDPFVPMGMIVDADITEAEKKNIAGDNLRRLIKGTPL